MAMPVEKVDVDDIRDVVSEEEWQLRCDLAACYRLVARNGWDDLIFTHISARVPGPEHHFLINPYGMYFHEITASSLVKIDLEGNIVLDTGYGINPAGFTIHSAIHAAREDAKCVLHLHTNSGVAVSCQKDGLLPISQTALIFYNRLSYHDYEGIALNPDEKPRLVKDLGENHAIILRNHGTLTVGESVAAAYVRMFFLERACQMQVQALAGGREIIFPPDPVKQTVEVQAEAGMANVGELEWPGLIRLLDKEQPDYKT